MNISSVISSTLASNSSGFFSSNGTVKESQFDVFKVVDIIGLIIGLPTNSYVIWLILTRTGNGLAAEFFFLNFSICEIILCVKCILSLLNDSSLLLVIVVVFVQGVPITGRPLFQSLISVERYLAVCHPVTFLKFKPLRYKVACAGVVWMATFASCTALIIMIILSVHINKLLGFVLAQLLLFLSIQSFCCVAVLRALKQSGPGERGREREEENFVKRRAFHLILITTVTMFIIYAPFIISMLFFVNPSGSDYTILSIGFACFALGGLVQPFLFLYRVRKLNFLKCQ